MKKLYPVILLLLFVPYTAWSQAPQGFFLDNWKPRTISPPAYNEVNPTILPATVSLVIDFADTVTKIPACIFGDNANLWTGCMSNNKTLMKRVADRQLGVLRGPGGSISDVFFWNRNVNQRPSDIPLTLPGSTEQNWPWYGNRPYSWETWTMAVDSFYSVLGHAGATGMITVNYGYARYGTGNNPVANAAHLAAEWVRYDKGRSRLWEVGNEVFGSWEAGYQIDQAQNKDAQPRIITPSLYGQHSVVFIDSMKKAAQQTGKDIRIGVVLVEASSTSSTWNQGVIGQAGDKADYFVVHSYYTPYNQNSDVTTILNSYTLTGDYKSYVWSELDKAGKPRKPVALTEYNIFAVGSNQAVSHANGMHAVLVTGEAIRTGYGATLRWDLANGWDNGNDHGMFSYNEPGLPDYTPHPAFFHLYFMRRFTGDVMVNYTTTGASGVVIFPTAFSSGQAAVTLVNTAKIQKVVRLNMKNFKVGDRYYAYTLTGIDNTDFSRKVFVNGSGPSLEAGGPGDYETIKASASIIGEEIKVVLPPLSSTFVLVDKGSKTLAINNEVTGISTAEVNTCNIFPNPTDGKFTVTGIPPGYDRLTITDMSGKVIYDRKGSLGNSENIDISVDPGLIFVRIEGGEQAIIKKVIIRQ